MKLKHLTRIGFLIVAFSSCILLAGPNRNATHSSTASSSLLQLGIADFNIIPTWSDRSDSKDSSQVNVHPTPQSQKEEPNMSDTEAPADTLSPTWLQMTQALLNMFISLYEYSYY